MKLGPATNFFFYGTLLDADIRQRVIGRPVGDETLTPATLAGFRRVRVTGKWFPMLVPGEAGDAVAGVIATGLSSQEAARLVAYEGADYGLEPVTLRLADGRTVQGQVFVPRAGTLKPSGEPWDLAAFQRDDKPRVLREPI
ncbi:MAG: gamma-glutamylcyclotransferase [Alphaproteobacteria bacterium]|nr:gamma-glutamylcyclotransferase [Alphaproteobacteria bacterium]